MSSSLIGYSPQDIQRWLAALGQVQMPGNELMQSIYGGEFNPASVERQSSGGPGWMTSLEPSMNGGRIGGAIGSLMGPIGSLAGTAIGALAGGTTTTTGYDTGLDPSTMGGTQITDPSDIGSVGIGGASGERAGTAGGPTEATDASEARNGYAHGGIVMRNKLVGPDPKGADQGYAPMKAGEGVLTAEAIKHYGKGIVSRLNKLAVPKEALTGPGR